MSSQGHESPPIRQDRTGLVSMVAGLVMLGALAVKNLDGTVWVPEQAEETNGELPWTSSAVENKGWSEHLKILGVGRQKKRTYWWFGWPRRFASQATNDATDPGRGANWPVLTKMRLDSKAALVFDIFVGVLMLAGVIHAVYRVQRLLESKPTLRRVLGTNISIGTALGITATVAVNIAIAMRGHDPLWNVKPIATGVLFVGIFLTCFAIIDWIGGLWSLATRRLFARSAQAD